jgi:ABC-type glycerol-3-phosphate transport system permease component
MARRRRIRLGDLAWSAFNYTVLALLAVLCLYPFLWVASASFSNPDDVIAGRVFLWPRGFTLVTYEYLLGYSKLWIAYANTLFYVVVGTTLNVILTMALAYPLSRTWFRGRRVLTAFVVFTMLFSGGMIPTFLVVRSLKLLNTRWAMILPTAVGVWEVIMARAYLTSNVPDELVEAGEIDGANDLQIFVRVVLPLSGPVIAVITLFYAVWHWNDYFTALIYLTDQTLYPLQIVLRALVTAGYQTSTAVSGTSMAERALLAYTLKYAAIMMGTIPIMMIYPFVQRHFVRGALLGSLKG